MAAKGGRSAKRWKFCVLLWSVSYASIGHAERDLDQEQPNSWYVSHVGLLVAGALTSAGVQYWGAPTRDPHFRGALAMEQGAESNFSLAASRATDVTLGASMIAPVVAFGSNDKVIRFDNSLLIYGESLSTSLVVDTIAKHLVLRARPYSFNRSTAAQAFADRSGKDASLSFYSGHAAMSFTGATAGSFLFSDSAADEGSQAALWALELALASFTTHGRVRAGMHYTTDVVVGALMGTGFGIGIPLLHGVFPEISTPEWIAMGGGLVLGTSLAFLLPTRTAEELSKLDMRLTPVAGGATFSVGSTLR